MKDDELLTVAEVARWLRLDVQTSSRFCLPQCGLKPTVLNGRKSLDIHARPLTRSESQ
jgi:hypothetical protein